MTPRRIVMVGTAFETHGGIASVVNAWRRAGLFARWPIEYIATHCDGSRAAKWVCALDAFFRVLALAGRGESAVLHVHGASRASFWRKSALMALARLAGWPIVFHLHGGGFARFYEKECGPLARLVVRGFLDRAASIIVVSERWAQWMRSVTRNAQIICIPNPVELAAPAAAPRDPALVAFVGRCDPGKGIFELLEALAAYPAVRLECAGDGDLGAVRRRAAELGIEDRVVLSGWIGRRRRAELLARAGVFVLPSHAEGVPMSLLEAMAAGCPLVASAVGGIPDVVVHGANGLLVPPQDALSLSLAIGRVLGDAQLAARLGAAARDTIAREFTLERSLERLEALYSGLGVASGDRPGEREPQGGSQGKWRRLQETS